MKTVPKLTTKLLDTDAQICEVKDKDQVVEFDLAAWAAENPEDEEDEEEDDEDDAEGSHWCPVCSHRDTQPVLMICDGCPITMHPFCAGYSDVPDGEWYCPDCTAARELLGNNLQPNASSESDEAQYRTGTSAQAVTAEERRNQFLNNVRRRSQQSRQRRRRLERARAEQSRNAWTNVSNRIHAVSGLELDFMDDDPSMASFRRVQRRASEERHELLEWEERLASANRRVANSGGTRVQRRRSSSGAAGSRPSSASGELWSILRVGNRTSNQPSSRPSSRPGSAGRSNPPHASDNRSQSRGHYGPTERRIREAVGPSMRRQNIPARGTSTPMPPELALAWGDLDRAQSMNSSESSNSRKRRAESPLETSGERLDHQEPERKLKRPRTRAVLDHAGSSSSSSIQTPPLPAIHTTNEPSFLASLLREVESTSGEDRFHWSPAVSAHESATSPSTLHLSPITSPSPASSNYHTPRASSLTPPPQQPLRTSSAHSTSSRSRSPLSTSAPARRHGNHNPSPGPEIRQPRPRRQEQFIPPRSLETSPTRVTMPIEAKESISKIVKGTLGPHWRSGQLTNDQYMEINRNVSRKMYEVVGDEYANIDRDRSAWERIAAYEVSTAIRLIQT